jgi:hypothetical protein
MTDHQGIATFCKTARESAGVLQIFPAKERPFRVCVTVRCCHAMH